MSNLGARQRRIETGSSDDETEGKHEDPNPAVIAFSLHLGG
jgi:hypothetical protein